MKALAKSITEQGLLHPIVCVEQDGALSLVAGERRLRAIALIAGAKTMYHCNGEWVKGTHIPCTLVSDQGELQLRQVELEENIQRIDLSWQDRVQAIDALHTLRVAANPKHTVGATGEELGGGEARREVAQAQVLARHLDNPAVAAARSRREAMGIASRIVEAEFRAVQEKHAKKKKSKHVLRHGDFRTMYDEKTFDCVIADPPYGMEASDFGDAAKLAHTYEDDPQEALDLNLELVQYAWDCTKDNAHMYLFLDIENFLTIRLRAEQVGWTPWRTPLIWHKAGTQGHAPLGERGFRRVHELILFCSRGDKAFGTIHNDVISQSIQRDRLVAAQKPVELYKKLLNLSCSPGELVLDPCCGSGTIFPAAAECFLTATGIEKDAETAKLAQSRLDELSE